MRVSSHCICCGAWVVRTCLKLVGAAPWLVCRCMVPCSFRASLPSYCCLQSSLLGIFTVEAGQTNCTGAQRCMHVAGDGQAPCCPARHIQPSSAAALRRPPAPLACRPQLSKLLHLCFRPAGPVCALTTGHRLAAVEACECRQRHQCPLLWLAASYHQLLTRADCQLRHSAKAGPGRL